MKLLHQVKNNSDIDKAKILIEAFGKSFIKYYGDQNLTFTFHVFMKHLIRDVLLHGSLSFHSMFSVESSLGYFRRKINGTRGLNTQYLISNLSCYKKKISFNQFFFKFKIH